jgi:signal transduction histidine kinase
LDRHHHDRARLVVTDAGIGIEPARIPHLFERLTQHALPSALGRQPLGLGLAITRHVIQLHGGTIEAFSEGLGTGATFTVLLPDKSRR